MTELAVQPDLTEAVYAVTDRAREASRPMGRATRAQKDRALLAVAAALEANRDQVLQANALDVAQGRSEGTSEALLDRLTLTPERIAKLGQALESLAALPDPVGNVVRGQTLPNGLRLRQVNVPLGVVAAIYEARPNVTVDAAGLALKSGNAVVLRGGSAARASNRALVDVLRGTLTAHGLPADAVTLLDEGGRDAVRALMRARGLVDVLIPRGGADLIRTVVEESTVPVIETGVGNCHVYVDAAADLDMALRIAVNSKTHRVSVCNSAESLLVHRSIAPDFLPKVLAELGAAGVAVHADPEVRPFAEAAGAAFTVADEDDFAAEYLSLDISVRVVDSLDDALAHVRRFGTGHTEAIVTQDRAAARRWTAEVDAAAVMVNASTRFTDGGEFGFGAEIGISTQKLHARGPMALPELTTTKWIVEGDGHLR
jgi:glutamate-5-semialdehyde dehydrogenase